MAKLGFFCFMLSHTES